MKRKSLAWALVALAILLLCLMWWKRFFIAVGLLAAPQFAGNVHADLLTKWVSNWTMDEAGDATRVDGPGGNDLIETTSDTVGQVSGKLGNAADFVAADTEALFIADGSQTGLDPGTGDFAISFWANITSSDLAAGATTFISKGGGDATEDGYWIGMIAGKVFFRVSNNGETATFDIEGATSLSTGSHFFLLNVARAGNAVLYVDNVALLTIASANTGDINATNGFNVARYDGSGGTIFFFDDWIDDVSYFNDDLDSTERGQLWNSGNGATYASFAAMVSITEQNSEVIPWKVLQRNGSNQASITASGTCTANETIEARFNGGSWATVDSTTSGGTWSGTLANQTAGRGNFEVRLQSNTGVTDSVANFGIGDVFVTAGDSNAEGRATNAQSYSGAAKNSKFAQNDVWAEGNDPIDTGSSNGSHWPLLASLIIADQSVPTAFITTGTGSSDLAGATDQWAEPNSAYEEMEAQVAASGVNGVKAVLMHVVPNSSINASTISLATYNTAVDTFISNVQADLAGAPKVGFAICGEVATGSPPDRRAALDNLRGAIMQAVGDNSNCFLGPVLIDQNYADDVHFVSDAEEQAVADRWWFAIDHALYSGTDGRGPRVSSITHNGAKTIFTVTFDRNLDSDSTYGGFRVEDGGSPATISGVARAGNAAVITLSSGASGTTTVSLGSENDAAGATIPKSTAVTKPTSGTIKLPAEPFWDVASTLQVSGTLTKILLYSQ